MKTVNESIILTSGVCDM